MTKAAPLFLIIILLIPYAANAQYLNYPESVVFDSLNHRYLVSSWYTGNLVQIDSNGVQSNFLTNAGCYAGLWIVDDNVYAASKEEGVKGYNLYTGDPVMDLSIAGTLLLNDIVADNSGNLYLSDPQAHKIIKVNINTHDTSTFVQSNIIVPNGLWFDEANNRLILVSARYDSPIQAISLEDSSVTTIINTPIDIMDGIARDDAGFYYISTWGSSRVYRFDSVFTYPPEVFSTHGQQPADIFYDRFHSVLAVPIFYQHTVDFVPVEQTYANDEGSILPERVSIFQNYPNPFNERTTITYAIPESRHIQLAIYDVLGRKVNTLVNGVRAAGAYHICWQAEGFASGLYFARLKTDDEIKNIRLTLLK